MEDWQKEKIVTSSIIAKNIIGLIERRGVQSVPSYNVSLYKACRTLVQTGTAAEPCDAIPKPPLPQSYNRFTTTFCACATSPIHQNYQKNIFQRILLRFGCDLTRRFRSDLKRCAQSGRIACIRFPSDISVLF